MHAADSAVRTWSEVYRPAIVAMVVVALGLIANTALEWLKIHLGNQHAARVLRRALVEELRVLQNATEQGLKRCSERPQPEGLSFLIPIIERFPVYNANISTLGVLTSAEVGAVTQAYAYANAMPEWLVHLGTIERVQDIVLAARVSTDQADALCSIMRTVETKLSIAVRLLDEED